MSGQINEVSEGGACEKLKKLVFLESAPYFANLWCALKKVKKFEFF